jgi:hypothetical protein
LFGDGLTHRLRWRAAVQSLAKHLRVKDSIYWLVLVGEAHQYPAHCACDSARVCFIEDTSRMLWTADDESSGERAVTLDGIGVKRAVIACTLFRLHPQDPDCTKARVTKLVLGRQYLGKQVVSARFKSDDDARQGTAQVTKEQRSTLFHPGLGYGSSVRILHPVKICEAIELHRSLIARPRGDYFDQEGGARSEAWTPLLAGLQEVLIPEWDFGLLVPGHVRFRSVSAARTRPDEGKPWKTGTVTAFWPSRCWAWLLHHSFQQRVLLDRELG